MGCGQLESRWLLCRVRLSSHWVCWLRCAILLIPLLALLITLSILLSALPFLLFALALLLLTLLILPIAVAVLLIALGIAVAVRLVRTIVVADPGPCLLWSCSF